jgi:hypothetical protein
MLLHYTGPSVSPSLGLVHLPSLDALASSRSLGAVHKMPALPTLTERDSM